eukprot:COSAG04_NODE_16989_length_483_cov_0.445312_1_plen_22_part_10
MPCSIEGPDMHAICDTAKVKNG